MLWIFFNNIYVRLSLCWLCVLALWKMSDEKEIIIITTTQPFPNLAKISSNVCCLSKFCTAIWCLMACCCCSKWMSFKLGCGNYSCSYTAAILFPVSRRSIEIVWRKKCPLLLVVYSVLCALCLNRNVHWIEFCLATHGRRMAHA